MIDARIEHSPNAKCVQHVLVYYMMLRCAISIIIYVGNENRLKGVLCVSSAHMPIEERIIAASGLGIIWFVSQENADNDELVGRSRLCVINL